MSSAVTVAQSVITCTVTPWFVGMAIAKGLGGLSLHSSFPACGPLPKSRLLNRHVVQLAIIFWFLQYFDEIENFFSKTVKVFGLACGVVFHVNPSTPGAHRCRRIGRSRAPRPRWFLGPGRTSGGGWDTRGGASLHLDFCQRVSVIFLVAAPTMICDFKAQAHVGMVGVAFLYHAFQHGSDD